MTISKNILTPKDQNSYEGQLEVWAGSHDVNFHCGLVKLFLEGDVLSLQDITFFLPDIYKKRICYL